VESSSKEVGNLTSLLITFNSELFCPIPTPQSKYKVNETSDIQLMAERLESLKAGIIGGLSLCSGFVIASFLNTVVLAKYFQTLASLQSTVLTGTCV